MNRADSGKQRPDRRGGSGATRDGRAGRGARRRVAPDSALTCGKWSGSACRARCPSFRLQGRTLRATAGAPEERLCNGVTEPTPFGTALGRGCRLCLFTIAQKVSAMGLWHEAHRLAQTSSYTYAGAACLRPVSGLPTIHSQRHDKSTIPLPIGCCWKGCDRRKPYCRKKRPRKWAETSC
jgi:hypothetical protein